MDHLRIAPPNSIPLLLACCRCGKSDRNWDRIAGKAFCPNCQEQLATGEGPPLVERTDKNRCAICNTVGTVCFHTFPLQAAHAVAAELCPEHLRGLLARRLGPYAYHQLRRQLAALGLSTDDLFLLHGAFYDHHGRALQPALEIG